MYIGAGASVEIARFDYVEGNNQIRLSDLEGFREKIYAVYGFGISLQASFTWSNVGTGTIYTSAIVFGAGLSVLGPLEVGYNQRDVTFK